MASKRGTKFVATRDRSDKDSGRNDPSDAMKGPRRSGGRDGGGVSDGAGTRERAGMPPETKAMAAPKAELPAEAKKLAAETLPVPGAYDPPSVAGAIAGWDEARDRKAFVKPRAGWE